MRKSIIYTVLCFAGCAMASAQNYSSVLQEIESNNSTLLVLREEAEAERLEARTGLTLSDPSLDLAHLWDIKNEGGYRYNIGASQSFDFPTVYYWKKRVSDGECTGAEIRYALGKKAIMLEAEQLCIQMTYHSALQKQLELCYNNAQQIAAAWEAKYEAGGASIVELNQAKLELLSASKAYKENQVECQALMQELERLNGGKSLSFAADEFAAVLLPADFEQWYADAVQFSSELQAVENAKRVAASATKLAGAEWLPKFSIGYTSEVNDEVSLHGIGVGISIPLWENRGKVKAAKAREAAAVARADDEYLQFHRSLKAKYAKALALSQLASEYQQTISELSSIEVLYTALEAGEIGIEDYVYGVELWQDAMTEVLASQRDCHLLVAELNNFSK